MSPLPPALNIVLVDTGYARIHAALSLAVGAAALNRQVRMFFQGEAVAALSARKCWPESDRYRAAGVATVQELFSQAEEMDVELAACETGMHLTGLRAGDLRPGCVTMGTIGFLAACNMGGDLVTI
ncbi:DsrE/DsrF/DrsH-like family protein [Pacificimonas sp. ICDLI1SI03]